MTPPPFFFNLHWYSTNMAHRPFTHTHKRRTKQICLNIKKKKNYWKRNRQTGMVEISSELALFIFLSPSNCLLCHSLVLHHTAAASVGSDPCSAVWANEIPALHKGGFSGKSLGLLLFSWKDGPSSFFPSASGEPDGILFNLLLHWARSLPLQDSYQCLIVFQSNLRLELSQTLK